MKNNFLKNLQKNKYLLTIPKLLKEEKTRKYTTLGLTLVTLIFFTLFAITPTLSTIANLSKQLNDEKFVDQQLQQKINNISSLQEEYDRIQPDLKYVDDSFPGKPDSLVLSAQIQAAAQESGVSLVGLEVSQIDLSLSSQNSPTASPSSFSINIIGNGSYENISNFIATLSNMQRVMTFSSISISDEGGESNNLTTNINAISYFKP